VDRLMRLFAMAMVEFSTWEHAYYHKLIDPIQLAHAKR